MRAAGLAAAALLLAAAVPAASAQRDDGAVSIEPHGGGGFGRGAGGGVERSRGNAAPSGGRGYSPGVIMKMHRVPVPAPRRLEPSSRMSPSIRPFQPPSRDDRGAVLNQRAFRHPPAHTSVVRNTQIVRSIEQGQRVEVQPRRYYWHDVGGTRYCHYYDGRAHWYGFYRGDRFYWSRYWTGFWWWYDPLFARWVYWWNGYWWWPGPAGVVYVYVDNNYYPYEDNGGDVIVKTPQVDQPPPQAPPAAQGGRSWRSPDGKRMVQVTGDQGEAYLYDTSGREPSYLAYLARGVTNARFSGGTGSKPLRVLLDFSDGSFALYDAQGSPVDSKSPATSLQGELPGPPPQPSAAPSGPTSPPPAPPGQ